MDLYNSTEITVHQLNELRQENKGIQIIDVREDTERDHAYIKGTIHMKLSEIAKRFTELDKDIHSLIDSRLDKLETKLKGMIPPTNEELIKRIQKMEEESYRLRMNM